MKISPIIYILNTTISENNDWSIELSNRITKVEKVSFPLTIYLNSKLLSRRTKVHLYITIIRPTITFECKVWTLTLQMEKKTNVVQEKY